MTSQDRGDFRLNVLNPGGRDPEQHFTKASAKPGAHAPVNYHAYAACTGGSFFRDTKRAIAADAPVLLLLRGDFRASARALKELKKAELTVAVCLKETGLHQIADQLRDSARLQRFLEIVRAADGCLASTPEAADIYRTIRGTDGPAAFIPTPYPLEDARWNLSRPIEERSGIFIGTREWDVPSRNHGAALLAARQISEATGESVTVFNFDGRGGARWLAKIDFALHKLNVLTERSSYADYLRVVARHKIIFQLDSSFVPGQVAGDALLCRVPCVGGNGAIERIGFPEFCGVNRAISELIEIAIKLLRDEAEYRAAVTRLEKHAIEKLSFRAIAPRLQEFFAAIASK
ncbi:MAG: hypothetical protein ACR2HH_00480 [Chthoniobacterales bacterium]